MNFDRKLGILNKLSLNVTNHVMEIMSKLFFKRKPKFVLNQCLTICTITHLFTVYLKTHDYIQKKFSPINKLNFQKLEAKIDLIFA